MNTPPHRTARIDVSSRPCRAGRTGQDARQRYPPSPLAAEKRATRNASTIPVTIVEPGPGQGGAGGFQGPLVIPVGGRYSAFRYGYTDLGGHSVFPSKTAMASSRLVATAFHGSGDPAKWQW
ncbi:hypothetical protein GCM10008997_11820 [Halomonas salifodinae]